MHEIRDSSSPIRTVRLVHPNAAVREAVLRWLEPHEKAARANAKLSFECEAGIVRTKLVSVRCTRFREWEPEPGAEPGMAGGSTEPEKIARTWQIEGDDVRVLDATFVDEEGNVERCSSEPSCIRIEPSPAFGAFVRRLLE